MHIKYNALLFILFIVFCWSCNNNSYQTADSGFKYRFIRDTEGAEFMNGEIVYFNMEYFDQDDSLLFSFRNRNIPVTISYTDTIWENNGQIYKALKMMNVGDSAIVKVNCRNLYEKSFRRPVPAGLDPDEEITFKIGVLKTSTPDEFKSWQSEIQKNKQEAAKEKSRERFLEELAAIDFIMEEKGIIPLETLSGIRYVIHKKGSGLPAKKGDKVSIHYRGKLLDGTEFDNSYDKNKPYDFVIGNNAVIEGWNEGISLMSEGAKYTFYIPSNLGYGMQKTGSIIKPNSILVYEIELINIERN